MVFCSVAPNTRTLRAALAYPSSETAFKDEELAAALRSSGLNHLTSSLDQIARWEKELVLEEQQCLVLTRVLLHKPRFLVTDEILDALEQEARKYAAKLFAEELKDTVILNIGRPETRSQFFTRVLYLIKDPNGHSFKPISALSFRPRPNFPGCCLSQHRSEISQDLWAMQVRVNRRL